MVKIRMKLTISGTRNGEPWPARGQVVDLPDDEAAQLCANGSAVPVTDDQAETRPDTEPAESRAAMTTQSAAALVPGGDGNGDADGAPDPATAPAPEPPKKTAAPAKKTAPPAAGK